MIREVVSYGRKMASDWAATDNRAHQWIIRASDGRYIQDGKGRDWVRHGANVAIHAGQRVVANRAAGRAIRRRARSDSFAGARVASLLALALVGQWWNPVSWWNDVQGWTVQAWNDVKNFVHSAIDTALSLVDGAFNLIDYVFTTITNALQAGLNYAAAIAAGAFDWIVNAAVTVGGWIERGVVDFWNDVIVPAIDGLVSAIDFVGGVLGAAINSVWGWIEAFVRDYLDPIWSWIVNAAETVFNWIWQQIDAFYNEYIAPIIHELETAWDMLVQVWNWLWQVGVDVVNAVIKAFDWIVWFGEHTFDDLRHLYDEGVQGVGLDGLVTAITDEYDDAAALLDKVASWLS